MVKQKIVCVIGAGVSGLVAAKTFGARGHQVTILERSGDLGGVWEPARSYPDVQTQSPKELYRYTDKPMPDSYPEWPKGPQVHAYLTDYAKDHGLTQRMRLNTAVVGMARRGSGLPGWTLEIRNPDGGVSSEEFDFVAVCTGQFNERQTISHPGEEAFKAAGGVILHSAQYTDPSTVKGKKVVVLGGSKSATDIAVNSVNAGASEVTLVYREPVWRSPTSSEAWSISSGFSTSAPRRKCSAAGTSAPSPASPMPSPNRSSGRTGAGWKACSRCN